MSSQRQSVILTHQEQIEAWQDAKRAVAAETDKSHVTDGEVVRALALAFVGHDGWDEVGREDGRGGADAVDELLEEVPVDE